MAPFDRPRPAFGALFVALTAAGCWPFPTEPSGCEELGTCVPWLGDDASIDGKTFDGGDAGMDVAIDQDTEADRDAGTEAGSDAVDAAAEPVCDPTKKPSEDPCVIDNRFGVFVSPHGNDDASGTKAAPFKTLGKALAVAASKTLRVYACDDATGYAEQVTISSSNDSIEMFGGFDCGDWSYTGGKRALVRSPSSPALKIDTVASGATIVDFEFDAPDATSAGGSSIGAMINASTGIVLARVKLVAAKAQDGANGTSVGGTAMSGAPGNAGNNACSANPNPGGVIAITLCDGMAVSAGGKGGDGANGPATVVAGGNGVDGTPPTAAGVGKGGQGEPLTGAWSCATGVGQPGDNGMDGSQGPGGAPMGTLTSAGWIGNRGGDGREGQPGQGGGGGGGARAPAMCPATDAGPPLSTPTGASGGSGGGGGCGGKGGQGGGAGGSSIALVSVASSVTLTSCELVASTAGNGGKGADGQPGGLGGSPGSAGTGVGGSKPACPGGIGGVGGNGGPGGGGAGGHSLGVAYTGTPPAGIATSTIMHAQTAAAGGAPGSGGDAAGKGADGLAAGGQAF